MPIYTLTDRCPSQTETVLPSNKKKEKSHYQVDFCSVIRIYNLSFSFDPEPPVDNGQKYISWLCCCKGDISSLLNEIASRLSRFFFFIRQDHYRELWGCRISLNTSSAHLKKASHIWLQETKLFPSLFNVELHLLRFTHKFLYGLNLTYIQTYFFFYVALQQVRTVANTEFITPGSNFRGAKWFQWKTFANLKETQFPPQCLMMSNFQAPGKHLCFHRLCLRGVSSEKLGLFFFPFGALRSF